MTNCIQFHPPGRDSPILRDPAAFGWVCVQSHIQRGTQLPGSWISDLLIRELFSAGHRVFASDTLCSSYSLLTSFVRLLRSERFSSWLVFIWVLCSLWTFASRWCQHRPFHPADSSAGGCTALFTTSWLTGALFLLLLYSDQCEFQVKPSLLCHVWLFSSWWN